MQQAKLQERGPPSHLSSFHGPQEKLFIFLWQLQQHTVASNN